MKEFVKHIMRAYGTDRCGRSRLHKLYSLATGIESKLRIASRGFSDIEDEVMTILEEKTADLDRDTRQFILGTIEIEKRWLESLSPSELSQIIRLVDSHLSSNKRYYSLGSYIKNIWLSVKNLITKASKSYKNMVRILILAPLKSLFYKQPSPEDYELFEDYEEIAEDVKAVILEMQEIIIRSQIEYRNKYEDFSKAVENAPTPDEFEGRIEPILTLLENARQNISPNLQTDEQLLVARSAMLVMITCALTYTILTRDLPSLQLEFAQQIFEHIGMIFYKIKSMGLSRFFVLQGFMLTLSIASPLIADVPYRELLPTEEDTDLEESAVELIEAFNEGDYTEASELTVFVLKEVERLTELGKAS